MDLSRFPRRRYSQGPSPIEFLPNFTKALGGPRVWIKRDDMLGLAPGGNKTRKLEFLMGDALAKGADTLVIHRLTHLQKLLLKLLRASNVTQATDRVRTSAGDDVGLAASIAHLLSDFFHRLSHVATTWYNRHRLNA